MTEMKPETVLPTLAVSAFKHREFVKVQAAIVLLALERKFVCPGDVDEDIVKDESKQGVKSNAWGALRALEIIERVPLGLTVEAEGIFGGRKRNQRPAAKGRFCAVYILKSRSLALAWLDRNGQPRPREAHRPPVQESFGW